MKNKHWKKERFQTKNKMWFNVYVINLFFWKCCAIQLNLPLPSITRPFFPIGLHGYEKGKLGLRAIMHYMWWSTNQKEKKLFCEN
jgi:hypothetical protein